MLSPAASRDVVSHAARFWRDHAAVIALGAIAVSVLGCLTYGFALGAEIRYADERDYLALTHAVLSGDGYASDGEPTAYRPPGIVFLLVPLAAVFGDGLPIARLVGIAALAVSAWLMFLLGRRLRSPSCGALAAVAVASYPPFVYTATTIYPQLPAMALLLGFLAAAFRAAERRGVPAAVVAGMCGGMLALTVPTLAVSVPIVAGWFARRHRPPRAVLAAMLVLAVLIPGAWTVRNAVVLDAFVPVSTNSGVNLLLGNSEHVTPEAGSAADITHYYEQADRLELSEVEANRFYRDQALDWISEHPAEAALLYVRKVAHTFALHNDLFTDDATSLLHDVVAAVTFSLLFALVVLRLALTRWHPLDPREKLQITLVVVNVLVIAVFFTRIRLRLPVDGLLILLAASALARVVSLPREQGHHRISSP
ncbi:ArnT family glycosyltransferase [Haloechinothrix salitolerans]|uniref:ArnT family glycosyltransferase n=1 Tax=Haloechinothrix salitolerans TaxID=926830 RepID=A0ABW2C681_9PSEU